VRRPVVLVPGWRDRPRALRHLHGFLVRAGWAEQDLALVEFRDRFGSNTEHAAEIACVLDRAGREPRSVDLVAHSMGGLATRFLLLHHPQARLIRRAIFLGSPHRGTLAAYLVWGQGAAEMRPGSPFLIGLRASPRYEPDLIAIRAPIDIRIVPPSSALLDGARNLRVPCLGHRHLLRARRVLERVRALLEEP
jgi:triacylglycerol lipase